MSNEAADLVSKTITMDDMWDVCAQIAFEIDVGQAALVRAGMRAAPDAERMRRVAVLENVCKFVEIVKPIEPELRTLIARKRGWAERKAEAAA